MERHCSLPESSNWSKGSQYRMSRRWNGSTHSLRVEISRNKVSIILATEGITLHTIWELKLIRTRLVSNWQQMEWHYALPESWNWSKQGQYQISNRWNRITHFLRVQIGPRSVSISSRWNAITHFLRVQIGPNKVSIKLAAEGMALRTNWELKLVQARLVPNWRQM